ncbi:hypothetical protein Tco_0341657, partial [Tanacetum coccineum]
MDEHMVDGGAENEHSDENIVDEGHGDNTVIMEYLEDTAYLCLHSPKTTKETRSNTPYPEEGNTPYSSYMEIKYSGRYQT